MQDFNISNKLNIALLTFCTIICIMFTCNKSSIAVARLSSCTLSTTSPNGAGLDGSNCDAGLLCDRNSNTCTYPTETACIGGTFPCEIGQKCVNDLSGTQVIATTGVNGICIAATNSSAENNAIGDVICNAYKFATGKVGRAVIVIVVFVTGITFYLGKVSWGTVVAILIGAGMCFGGPAIVSVLIGRGNTC